MIVAFASYANQNSFIQGGLALVLDFALVCKAVWSLIMAPPVQAFNIITAGITIFVDLILVALLIVAGVFAFRGLGPTFTDDYRKKYGGYDRRITSGVLFLLSWYAFPVSFFPIFLPL